MAGSSSPTTTSTRSWRWWSRASTEPAGVALRSGAGPAPPVLPAFRPGGCWLTVTTPPSRIRHRSLARRLVDRPEVGAAIGLVVVWGIFAATGGHSGFLTAQGTISYL